MQNWMLLLPLVLGAVGLFGMLPGAPQGGRIPCSLAAIIALAWGLAALTPARDVGVEALLFYVFAGSAILSSGLMLTNSNPVYAALWFAVATLGVCGLFLLNSAPFLAAATIIVYAGAIVVTFVFVIMLAQQEGEALYDRKSQQPIKATIGGFVLLGCLVYCVQNGVERGVLVPQPVLTEEVAAERPHPMSRVVEGGELGLLRGFGRSLFGDYLYSVELAGTLLLIATIGAIAVAPRRAQGGL